MAHTDIPEPAWRSKLYGKVESFVKDPWQYRLAEVLDEYLRDGFDPLVQAIARGRLDEARAILHKHYPGSLERQEAIEQAMRGPLDE